MYISKNFYLPLFLFIYYIKNYIKIMSSHVHALNTSPAKLKYSFGKATRFQPYKAK